MKKTAAINSHTPTVSIIIPTFNRGRLICETLDSIVAQTYENWECIVVDDGSSDETERVVRSYVEKDPRIHYYARPSNIPKGADGCRNYGFELARGTYVKWFDSDDLMLPTNLELKVNKLLTEGCDFVVAKTSAFNDGEHPRTTRDFGRYSTELTLNVFAKQEFSWLTIDGLYSRKSVSKVSWNEELESGQDFNFISRYLAGAPNGVFIDEVVSLVRRHPTSIQGNLFKGSIQYNRNRFNAFFQTYEDLNCNGIKIRSLLIRALGYYYKLETAERPIALSQIIRLVRKHSTISEIVIVWWSVLGKMLSLKVKRLYRRVLTRFFG